MTPPRDENSVDTTRIQEAIQQRRASRKQAQTTSRKRQWRRYTWIGTVVIGSLLLILTVYLLRTQVPESFAPEFRASDLAAGKPVSAYHLYFLSADGNGLISETVYLSHSGDFATDAETLLAALFGGSKRDGISPWPVESTVQDLFVSRDGVAYINFGASLKWLLPRGDIMEWAVVASLTRTLCDNFTEVSSIRLLIDGEGEGPLRDVIPLDWEFRPSMFGVSS
jgi:Sporulation and spore germination